MEKKRIAEFAFDIQSGLGRTDAPEFDKLRTAGMAASLAVHIRGLGEIDYEVLRKVCDFYFDIPSYALKPVIDILVDIDFIDIIGTSHKITKIIPKVPHFGDLYSTLGNHHSLNDLNEHEQAALHILGELQTQPQNVDRLFGTSGIDAEVFNRCVSIGETNGLVRSHRVRGKTILTSPIYFADSLSEFADLAAASGSSDIGKALDVIKRNQGWPLSVALKQQEIGGVKLTNDVSNMIHKLAQEGILKPPSIKFSTKQESFLFTPKPGAIRMDAANRDIYERAMAIVASVRKGQLLADVTPIKWPLSILRALRDVGFLKSNSDAFSQYQNLVGLRVGYLLEISSGRWQFHMRKDPENQAALDLAIKLLESGDLAGMELNQDARIALSKDEKYIQSVVASAELRKREQQVTDQKAAYEFEQLMLKY
ncbi:hypothetical protein H8K35_14910 [Undibacterium sp. LX40W]|uniref:Uncharacterized protein n=1 Tax=Undibacterium nitidum TaxID=2762298 RepID=A0A923HSU4_9BURK|nr:MULTISPECIES: hypothetical protein [Undibacterium]MBC3882680.1 hypothetical protein [Undibacterium nitidum]MBC3892961.1 hypothetical protein [Undibacterium sp. LX40W]